MQGYNCIAVFDHEAERWLMCLREKEPYKGLLNLVGGKIEDDEEHLAAAYRELEEETAITEEDIKLTHLMDFCYPLDDCFVEVYVGRLNKPFKPHGDENKLIWTDLRRDFADMKHYAGEGNIAHMLEHIKMHSEQLIGKKIK
ncbi:MAG: NUDIX domain-containing protein [Ruminococcus sp.]|nr:NUDIX domain-containing protein [Ruminococcus sp.]